ncbi:MAG: hypothetical protein JO035_05255 [Betaproteobacteria bacterium]|nr:hypothetical protein [Betaproteobacteria bacterium]
MDLKRRPPEDAWIQERYALWLDRCTRIAFAVTLAAFLLYASGLAAPWISLEQLPALWQLSLPQYLQATGAATGWQWLRMLRYGDYLNIAGISLFALVILVCHGAMIVPFLARGERLLALLAALQVAVLVAAASGFFAGG